MLLLQRDERKELGLLPRKELGFQVEGKREGAFLFCLFSLFCWFHSGLGHLKQSEREREKRVMVLNIAFLEYF